MEARRDPGYWINKERMKWHLYEAAKRRLRWREDQGQEINYEAECQKLIKELKI
jgi:hypothetical protein